jgi:hypothetical protein
MRRKPGWVSFLLPTAAVVARGRVFVSGVCVGGIADAK